ncbi:MAG TPA: hypothetical protein VEC08_04305 [Nitrososphaerales archaeon]|nr:hypothetical protein [Nitrososphaerales archaeon]
MRVSTAATRKAIDKWKERTRSEASRFYISTGALLASLFPAPRRGRFLLALALVLATMVNFAFSELALLVLLGFLTAKLHCYRLVNSFLRFMPPAR